MMKNATPLPRARARPTRLVHRPPAFRLSFFRVFFMVFTLVASVVILYDMKARKNKPPPSDGVMEELQEMVLGLDGPRYDDPSGLFSLVVPPRWTVIQRPKSDPYNVVLRSPRGADISIVATRVSHNDPGVLQKEIEDTEEQTNIHTDKKAIVFLGHPAVQRASRLTHTQVLAIDFVDEYVEHHINCSMPPAYADKYEPVLMDVLKTYRPGRPPAPTAVP